MNPLCYWIWLSRIEGVNAKIFYELLQKYQTPENIWNLSFAQLVKDGIDFFTAQNIINKKYRENLEKYFVYMQKNQIEILTYKDNKYPELLKNIYDFPIVLYIKGNQEILNQEIVALVGCRNCTAYGEQIAKNFSYELSKKNIHVISGMARGIDTFAHMRMYES